MTTALRTGRRRVKADVAQQRRHDSTRRKLGWPQFEARYQAVGQARQAVRKGEQGARSALRQSLIDLAACCEEIAEPMAAPDVILSSTL